MLVAGAIDPDTSSGRFFQTNSELVLLELGEKDVTTRASTMVPAYPEVQFSGGRIVVDSDDGVQVLSATDLSEVAQIAEDNDFASLGPNYILTVDRDTGRDHAMALAHRGRPLPG